MDMDVLRQVGARIRDLRKDRGFSQEVLGEKGGFHFSYIGQVERGEKNISLQNLAKIAVALNVPLTDLFAYVQHSNAAPESNLSEIVELLKTKNPQQLRMVKNILLEIFQADGMADR